MANGAIKRAYELIDFTSQCTFPSGKTPAHFFALAYGDIGIIMYQGPLTTFSSSDLLVTLPTQYAFDDTTFEQTFAVCAYGYNGMGTVTISSTDNTQIKVGVIGVSSNVRPYFEMIYPIKT